VLTTEGDRYNVVQVPIVWISRTVADMADATVSLPHCLPANPLNGHSPHSELSRAGERLVVVLVVGVRQASLEPFLFTSIRVVALLPLLVAGRSLR